MLRAAPTVGLAMTILAATIGTPGTAAAQDAPDPAAQRKALLDLRANAQNTIRTVNQLLEALGPLPPLPRERPAMVPCPWKMPQPPTVLGEPIGNETLHPPPCHPPGWTPPAELEQHDPPPLPKDRPRAIVTDYLSYTILPPPPELVERLDLDTTYYKKHADATGYPILASANVPDAALAIVRDQVNYMLAHRPDIRDEMIARGASLVIMAETEYTMDIPEQRNWTVPAYRDPRLMESERGSYFQPGGLAYRSAEAYWNRRARGMGGARTSCAEENVLGYYGTRYWGTNICVHEFSHAIMGVGIGHADPRWFQEIVNAYKAAKAMCLPTADGYAGNTFNEYWAVNLEWYVGNGGRDRAALKAVDPRIYELISRLIPENRHLPGRANVAHRPVAEMNESVRASNREWWAREQERQRLAAAERARVRRASAGGGGGSTCVPTTVPASEG